MAWTVDVISDVICPWCYVGKRRLEKAIAALNGRANVRVRWHPFQLNPQMPKEGMDRRLYRTAKFGSWERSLALDAQVTEAGRAEVIQFAFDKIERTPNTLDAQRLVGLAEQDGVQDAVVEAIFRAYFTEGQDITSVLTLLNVVNEAGLDRNKAEGVLHSDDGLDEIRAGQEQARRAGVQGVPFYVINGILAFSGARFPAWAEKVEFWHVDDGPEVLGLIEREVMDLAARLIGGGRRRVAPTPEIAADPVVTKQAITKKNAPVVRLGRETKGRRGKGVTTVSDLPLDEAGLLELAATLKQRCGTGGTVKDGTIEIQGDQRDRLAVVLEGMGYRVKRVGG